MLRDGGISRETEYWSEGLDGWQARGFIDSTRRLSVAPSGRELAIFDANEKFISNRATQIHLSLEF